MREKISQSAPRLVPPAKRRKTDASYPLNLGMSNLNRPSHQNHGLSFPSLQLLIMALESVQHFPEERQIYIE